MSTILPINTFHSLLRREMALSDRNGNQFSLLVCLLWQEKTGKILIADFIEFLSQRIRRTDVVGWYSKDRIGVYLADTSADQAARFAADLNLAIKDQAAIPDLRIFAYTSRNKIAEDNNGSEISLQSHNKLGESLNFRLPAWKRGMDIGFSVLGLVILAPFLGLIALLIKVVSPGPAIFRQERVGFQGESFTMLKFRTMDVLADDSLHEEHIKHLISEEKPLVKMHDDDPRIFPLGKILRQSCIDELPQLINVLRGEMSIVGPRPDVPYAVKRYQKWHLRRFETKPGMTGLWQISGKNTTTLPEMIRLDISYINQMSLLTDLKIILKTIPALIN